MPPAAFLHPQNAPKSLAEPRPRPHYGSLQRYPDPLAGLRGPLLREEKKEGRWDANMRKGEVTGGEGRDFGPSQCWKQIDAADDAASPNEAINETDTGTVEMLSVIFAHQHSTVHSPQRS